MGEHEAKEHAIISCSIRMRHYTQGVQNSLLKQMGEPIPESLLEEGVVATLRFLQKQKINDGKVGPELSPAQRVGARLKSLGLVPGRERSANYANKLLYELTRLEILRREVSNGTNLGFFLT